MRNADVSHRRLDFYSSNSRRRSVENSHLEELFNNEDKAREYLLNKCRGGRKPFCPRCREHKLYSLSGDRYRCSSCKYTFQDFSCRWINNGGLKMSDWLKLVHLFSGEMTAHGVSNELGISYNAAYKAITAIRYAILSHAIDAAQLLGPETELGEYLKGRKLTGVPKNKYQGTIPVFGIMEKNDWVFIDLMQNINAESVFHFNHNFHLKLVKNGNIIHTDRYQNYDALILCGNDSLPMDYIRKYSGITPHIEKSGGEFWKFARERLKKYKGISTQRFPLYLKELEFRFNYRNKDIFELLTDYLCKIVPEV